jgi:hypothetical protein
VAQLRELDLELAFVAAGALREDVEDQRIAVEHAPTRELLEIAFLARRQRVVDEDHVGLLGFGFLADLVGLAAADEEPGIRAITPTRDVATGLAPAEVASCVNSLRSSWLERARPGRCAPELLVRRCGVVSNIYCRPGDLRARLLRIPARARCARERPSRWRACRPSG